MIVAVVGAGTIGLSWAALFASQGHDVRLHDPRPDLQELLDAAVGELSDVLPGTWRDRIVLEPRFLQHGPSIVAGTWCRAIRQFFAAMPTEWRTWSA